MGVAAYVGFFSGMKSGVRAILGAAIGACSPGSVDGGSNNLFLLRWPWSWCSGGSNCALLDGCLGFYLLGLAHFIWSHSWA